MGVPYVIVYVECDRLGVKSCKLLVVSVCALVAVYSDMGCLVVEGIHVGTYRVGTLNTPYSQSLNPS
jgi:hypothetical protein